MNNKALMNLHLHIESILASSIDSFYKTEAIMNAIADYDESYIYDKPEERHWHQIGLSDREFLLEGTTHTQENYLELIVSRFYKYYLHESARL